MSSSKTLVTLIVDEGGRTPCTRFRAEKATSPRIGSQNWRAEPSATALFGLACRPLPLFPSALYVGEGGLGAFPLHRRRSGRSDTILHPEGPAPTRSSSPTPRSDPDLKHAVGPHTPGPRLSGTSVHQGGAGWSLLVLPDRLLLTTQPSGGEYVSGERMKQILFFYATTQNCATDASNTHQ